MNYRQLYPIAFLFCLVAGLIVFLLPHLSLPFYWDEAWPYRVAVEIMYRHGLSLSPSAIPSFESRGHPVMFHFLAAGWMKIFGSSVVAVHCFALTVTIATIVGIYTYCRKFFNTSTALFASILFALQPVTLSQACFLLPEMMMAMWATWVFYAWCSGYRLLFVLLASAMLLTKESGVVLVAALGIYEVGCYLGVSKRDVKNSITRCLLIAAPVFVAALYFIAQKQIYGWYLYPLYMNYISAHGSSALGAFTNILAYLLISYSRNAITFFALLSLVVCFYKKYKFTEDQRKAMYVMAIYLLVYSVFSSVNVYIPRYMLGAFPFYIFISAALIDKVVHAFRTVYVLLATGLIVACGWAYNSGKSGWDCDYTPSIRVDQEVVRLCEQMHLQDKKIMAPCNLRSDLTFPEIGYLAEKPFHYLNWDFNAETEYCIFNAGEYDPSYEQFKKDSRLRLIKRFEDHYAWCELYKVVR